MALTSSNIRLAQRRLGFTGEDVDGRLGRLTEGRLDTALAPRADECDPRHRDAILTGPRTRKIVAYLQLLARDLSIETGPIDGQWGPQTAFAVDSLAHHDTHGTLPRPWRDIEREIPNPNGWPLEKQSKLVAFYGQVGTNQTRVDVPYVHRLSWDLRVGVTRIGCHKKVAPSLVRVLTRVLDHYGTEQIRELRLDRWGGCFNKRRKRGGTSWSTHAWGIALDYDPERNQLKWGRSHAAFARPEYDKWWEFWEDEGWISLGRVKNFDWMHVQAARR